MKLSVEDLHFRYGSKTVLDGVTLDVKEGEILGIVGPNGCGKTTLLGNLNKNLSPKSGKVVLGNTDLEEMTKKDIAKIIAAVPQTNEFRFSFTVRDIVSMGRMPFQTMMGGLAREDVEIIDEALRKTGLSEMADRHINTMSGGERQRIIIARAIAQTPEIILMDEPTLHLDVSMQFDALNLVHRLSMEHGLTVVIVSHDLPMMARYCDRIIMLHNHSIHAVGTPGEVLTPENLRIVFNVDGEMIKDPRTGRSTVLLHDSLNEF